MAIADEVRARRRLPSPAMARQIRVESGVSTGRMAAELQVQRITVSRWERGTRTPTGDLLVAYVELLEGLRKLLNEGDPREGIS